MIRRLLVGIALTITVLAGTAFGNHSLPWKLFSEQAKDAVRSEMVQCSANQEVFTARFERDGDAYRTFYGVESNGYLVMYYKGNVPEAMPDEVGVGKVDPAKHDEIPALKWMSVDEAKSRYPSLCNALFPESA